MPLPEIVTLEEVDAHLRLGGDVAEHALLHILIAAATEAAMSFADQFDSTQAPPARLKLAVLTHIARAYQNREDGADAPSSALNLIRPLRTIDI